MKKYRDLESRVKYLEDESVQEAIDVALESHYRHRHKIPGDFKGTDLSLTIQLILEHLGLRLKKTPERTELVVTEGKVEINHTGEEL